MRVSSAALLCVTALAVVLVGCGGSAAAIPQSVSMHADVVVPCSARVEPPPAVKQRGGVTTSVARFADGGRFVLAFGTGPSKTRIGGRRVWVWKTPVVLSADLAVVLSIDAVASRRARLSFTGMVRDFQTGARRARFEACSADTRRFSEEGVVGPETGWAGSLITLDRRVCLRVRTVTARESVKLKVPLGRRCPRG